MLREMGSAFPLVFDGPLAGRRGRHLSTRFAVELDDGTVIGLDDPELGRVVERAIWGERVARTVADRADPASMLRSLGS